MATGKFIKGMFIGAAVGGALTLFDKETRDAVIKKGKIFWKEIKTTVRNPKEKVEGIRTKVELVMENYRELSEELKTLTEKAKDLVEAGEGAKKLFMETAEVFKKDENGSKVE